MPFGLGRYLSLPPFDDPDLLVERAIGSNLKAHCLVRAGVNGEEHAAYLQNGRDALFRSRIRPAFSPQGSELDRGSGPAAAHQTSSRRLVLYSSTTAV